MSFSYLDINSFFGELLVLGKDVADKKLYPKVAKILISEHYREIVESLAKRNSTVRSNGTLELWLPDEFIPFEISGDLPENVAFAAYDKDGNLLASV